MTHATLVQLGVRWLSRKSSVVLYEAAATKAEIPDVIGWSGSSSILIECKSSRADFLRDAGKKSRTTKLGMAQRRYYLCPAGLIEPDEVPAKWGLLWAAKNSVTVAKEAKRVREAQLRRGDSVPERYAPRADPHRHAAAFGVVARRKQIRSGTRSVTQSSKSDDRREVGSAFSPMDMRCLPAVLFVCPRSARSSNSCGRSLAAYFSTGAR